MSASSPETVGEVLDQVAGARPDAPATVFPEGRATYGELAAATVDAARRLRTLGVGPGDVVAILSADSSFEVQTLGVGAMRLGALCAPLNARFRERELAYVLGHCKPKVLFVSAELEPLARAAGAVDPIVLGDRGFADASDDELPAPGAADPALLLYTSGTTADPKGCVHTHSSLVAQGEGFAERLDLGADERFWTPLPKFHVGGWVVMLACHARGACYVHIGRFEPGAAIEQLEAEKPDIAFPAFETIWLGVLHHPRFEAADLSSLRLVINVGVPERMVAMQERLPSATQVSCTGSTESCGFLTLGRTSDSPYSRSHTCGPPLPAMEVRIVDPETRAEQPVGVAGEMLFRGASRFSEYYEDPEATAAAIDADGWFSSGDLLTLQEDGSLSFGGRLKDMLKVGGENVSPAEIEGVLIGHAGVRMAQVVAAPDAHYGEVAAAFVERAPGETPSEEELVALCRADLAGFKVPRYVRFVDEWPMSGTKVRKVELRERIAQELRDAGITQAPRASKLPS